jgi:hypothetical protein
MRGTGGLCIGDPATWQMTSAAIYFAATADGVLYPDVLNDHVDITVSRLCATPTFGLSPLENASLIVPRPGLCGPALTVYFRVSVLPYCAPSSCF